MTSLLSGNLVDTSRARTKKSQHDTNNKLPVVIIMVLLFFCRCPSFSAHNLIRIGSELPVDFLIKRPTRRPRWPRINHLIHFGTRFVPWKGLKC